MIPSKSLALEIRAGIRVTSAHSSKRAVCEPDSNVHNNGKKKVAGRETPKKLLRPLCCFLEAAEANAAYKSKCPYAVAMLEIPPHKNKNGKRL